MSVCIIPARGGSKRIPRKNIRTFIGRPMISWSIDAALEAGCFDSIVVSTDDEEIADVARKAGAETPFLRSVALADDHTPTVPVIADAIARLGLGDDVPVCCLYATAPFVTPEDLRRGQDALPQSGMAFIASVTSYAYPIQRALFRGEDGGLSMVDAAQSQTRSQDLTEAWHDAGQFYWGLARSWSAPGARILGEQTYGLTLPRHRVQDIDTEEDWTRAEIMLRQSRTD